MPTVTGISRINLNAELTDRQYEICEQGILGHTCDEVSIIFERSPFTIINTFRSAFRKTGARNIQELSVWYYCKKFGAAIDFSNPMRRIIAMFFLLIFLPYEFSTHTDMMRSGRARTRTVNVRGGKRNDYPVIEF